MSTDLLTRRLFFALWPNDQIRQSITDVSSMVPIPDNGCNAPFENLHITLHFIGQVTHEAQDCMHHAAQSIDQKSFLVNLDRFGYFDKAKIFWMGCQRLPVELMQLHLNLGASFVDCDYISESRKYQPHVTLMRKCRSPVSSTKNFVIPWMVDEFTLVESTSDQSGINYKVIEKYPLA